jgi:hypothetical protein
MGDQIKNMISLPVLVAVLICDATQVFSSERKILLRKNWFLQSSAIVKENRQKIPSDEFHLPDLSATGPIDVRRPHIGTDLPLPDKELAVEFRKSDLQGQRALLKQDGWNIRKQILEPGF